jgi:ABC-type multidrug transport system, ATPase component
MIIEINNLTKDYGNNKGIFDINMEITKGEIFGFLGPNGAGKTTTIRNLMGFIKPDKGTCKISELDCFINADMVQENVGYIPGETAFMNDMTGIEFIKFIASYRNLNSLDNANRLIKRFDLDPNVRIKRMSKGMKQKVAIVLAFMHDPDILILDEPTSGLDPLMQKEFIKLLLEEKEKGKTILMSSHIFEEIEKTCDRVSIIKDGKIVSTDKIENLKKFGNKVYTISFKNDNDLEKFKEAGFYISNIFENKITVTVSDDVDKLIKVLSKYNIIDLNEEKQNLEDIFMKFYGGDNND